MKTLARWLSILGHPFVMVMAMVLGTALRFSTPREAVRAVALVALIALVPVALLMVRQVRSGSWANVDASNLAERPVLFIVGIGAVLALLATTLAMRPGSFLIRGTVGVLVMLAVCAVATTWIKVSLHAAFGALAATTLLLLGSPSGWPLFAVLPVLAWSRLALGRHTASEVVAGVFVGLVFGYAIVSA